MHQGAHAVREDLEDELASNGALLEQIYGIVLSNLEEAKRQFRGGNGLVGRERVKRASRVLSELRASLRTGYSGAVSREMDGLYAFCVDTLVRASDAGDAECVDDVIRILCPLRDAWVAASRFEELLAG